LGAESTETYVSSSAIPFDIYISIHYVACAELF